MLDIILIPTLKLNPSYLAVYKQVIYPNGRRYSPKRRVCLPTSNSTHGKISSSAARKIKSGIDWLLLISQNKKLPSTLHGRSFLFKLSFITLTLSSTQKHTDNEIKKSLLHQFLIEAGQKWHLRHYLWRAESQVNGNIHFHIVSDRYIPWSELRDTWNRIQEKFGYVSRYRNEMLSFHNGGFRVRENLLKKWTYKAQLRAYRTGSRQDWNSPNSTDVHSIKQVRNLSAYLAKYCTKNQEGREIQGQLWGLSESLSKLYSTHIEIDSHVEAELQRIIAIAPNKLYESDYYSIIYIDIHVWHRIVNGIIFSQFASIVNSCRAAP